MTLFKLHKNQHKSMRKLDHDQKALMIKSYDFVSNPPPKKKKKTKDEVSFRMKSQTLKSKKKLGFSKDPRLSPPLSS